MKAVGIGRKNTLTIFVFIFLFGNKIGYAKYQTAQFDRKYVDNGRESILKSGSRIIHNPFKYSTQHQHT